MTTSKTYKNTTLFEDPTIRIRYFHDHRLPIVEDYPVLDGYVLKNDPYHVFVWCPYCQEMHLHGRGALEEQAAMGVSSADGHRVAHCIGESSPFKHGGYIVKTQGFTTQTCLDERKPECEVCGKRLTKRSNFDRRPYHVRCEESFLRRYLPVEEVIVS